MKLITRQLEASHNIFFFGDKHEGSVLSSNKAWETFVEAIQSPYDGCANNYGAEGGDDIEAIIVDDPRFDPEKMEEPLPLAQMEKAIEIRQPIKNLLLYKLLGNHERKLWRFGNITKGICERLGVEYGTYTAKLIAKDRRGKLMYKVYDTHGFKNISSMADDPKRRRSNMELILKRQLKFQAGDCAVMIKHHVHKLLVSKPEAELFLVDDGSRVKQAYTGWGQNEPYIHPDARWYGCAGSFLRLFGKGISGYAEIMEYPPTELGFLVLRVRNKKIISLDPYYVGI